MKSDLKPIQQPPEWREDFRWYCAVVNPGCYARAEGGLYAAGYPTLAPKYRRWVSHARTKTAKEYPLLVPYLMVACDPSSFFHVRATGGIESLISGPEGPLPFPDEWVHSMRERYMMGEWDYCRQEPVTFVNAAGELETRTNPPIPIGARIEIMAGEFADMLATVTGKKGKRGKTIVFKVKDANQYSELHQSDVRPAWDWHKETAAA
jgi:transcription antitermination factor NusG